MPQKQKRKFFTKLHDVIELPDLIRVQTDSYDWFF